MFFFFVGGVEQQVGRVLKEGAGRCLRCGSTADLVEYEKVLKLFFVPVWRWPGKDPAFYCRDCSFLSPHSLPLHDDDRAATGRSGLFEALRCDSCSRVVDPQFRFCPFCGSAL
ncbi:hypothetical protein C4D60_Mb11t16610 [Musa balbisiana]|uniref:Zinc-ribbon 15 domain-containing protein n=1 Tax=Musa balbisiana TaxID=52838 RepID=A0A4S8J4R7_MUSBA|nr:hypothetical protein C4D60_Mb11t16610 [Musa balbisiana]